MKRTGLIFLGSLALAGEVILVLALVFGGFAVALHWLLRAPMRIYLRAAPRSRRRELPSILAAIDSMALVWIARGIGGTRAKREEIPAGPVPHYRGENSRVPF